MKRVIEFLKVNRNGFVFWSAFIIMIIFVVRFFLGLADSWSVY